MTGYFSFPFPRRTSVSVDVGGVVVGGGVPVVVQSTIGHFEMAAE